jgi:ankyrin repeat protein
VDITDVDGRTPLHYGAEAGTEAHMRCVSLLFDAGANVNATSSQRKTPLHMAATGGPAFEAGFKLLRPLPPMDAPPSHPPGGTADGNSAMVSHLTKLGANLEAVDLEGNTPLLAAARCNNHLCVQRLLLLGARVYHANVRGHTALHLAAFHHCEPAVRQLVRWDAEVGKLKFILDSSGRSAYDMAANSSTRAALHTLFEAAASGRLDLVQAVARDTALLPAAAQNPWLPVRVWESTRVTARGVLHCVVTGAARAMAQLRKDCEKPGAAERMAAAAALGGGSNQRVADALFKSVAQRRERESRVNGAKGTGLPAHKIAPSAVHIVAGMGLRFVTDHRRDAAVGGALPAQEYRDWGGDFADVLLTFPVVADPFLLEQSVDATAFVPRPGAHKMFIPTSILGDASRSEAAAARVVPGNELTSSVTEKEYGRVLDFLLKAGAAVEHGDRDGVTPLHLAAKYGLLFLVRKLLKAGASPTARDKELNTPFHYAAAFCQPAAADILGEFAKEGDDAAQQRNAAGQAPADVGGMGMLILPRAAEGDIVVQRYPPKSKSLAVTKAM